MTTGSLVLNRSTPWTDPGNSWYGLKYSASWSGADAPKVKRKPKIPIELTRYSRKRGTYRVTIYVRDPSSPPGGRSRGEHGYSKTVTNYNSSLITFRPTGWSSDRTIASWGWCAFGSFTDFSGLQKSAKLAAQSELRAATQGSNFNVATFLGEMGQTLGVIGDVAATLAEVILSLKAGRWSQAVKVLFDHNGRFPKPEHLRPRNPKEVAQKVTAHWLELQYGWLPLLSDVKSASEAFADKMSQPQRYQVRFGKTLREVVKASYDFGNKGIFKGSSLKEVLSNFKVTFKSSPPVAVSLGLADPLTVAWELLPYSFVVDWFLPIGQYLEAVGGPNGLSIESVVYSEKSTALITIPLTAPSSYFAFSRTITSTWPSAPLPQLKPLSEALSYSHCMNGIALLTQAVH